MRAPSVRRSTNPPRFLSQLEARLRESLWRRLRDVDCICDVGNIRVLCENRAESRLAKMYCSVFVDGESECRHWFGIIPMFLRASLRPRHDRLDFMDRLIALLFRYRGDPEFWTIPKSHLSFFSDAGPVFGERIIASDRVVLVIGGYQEWSDVTALDVRLDLKRYLREMDAWWCAIFNDTETRVSDYLHALLLS